MSTLNFNFPPPISLYIHIPWCIYKCPYCDFNSHISSARFTEIDYIDALIRDLEQEAPYIAGRTIQNIFIGGGTPSLFSAKSYQRLLSAICTLFRLRTHAEITLEANPETCNQQNLDDYLSLGINRLSIGIQSFNNKSLKALGRVHDKAQAIRAIEDARRVGFKNINADLLFAPPHQTNLTVQSDIDTLIALEPDHISYYQMGIEPNTLYYGQPPILPNEDLVFYLQMINREKLEKASYHKYEISSYMKNNKQSQHNLNYWQFGDYLGIGTGAHGKITDFTENVVIRRYKENNQQAFMDTSKDINMASIKEEIAPKDIAFEFMLNALRLTDGFQISLFCKNTGLPIFNINEILRQSQEQGLLRYDLHDIRPMARGLQYLNSLIELFLSQ